MDNSIGVYIHIPFCKSKCYYCDFNSYSGRESLAGSYFDAVQKEIASRSRAIGDRPVSTIFIGGGTPSLVDPGHIQELLKVCSKHLNIDRNAEISMESNPGTLNYEKLKLYRQMGINRLSIGLQAWQDDLLAAIGRIHDRQQFVDNLNAAVEAGFENINVDLIFGLPGQTFEDWAETLDAVTGKQGAAGQESPISGCIKHISCYSLKIEEGTVLGNRLEAGQIVPVDDELDRRMYHYAVDMLGRMGYRHYEISNFAYPGYECRHNLVYWKAREYAGFGAGAHSYLNSSRFSNVADIEEYMRAFTHTYADGNADGMAQAAEYNEIYNMEDSEYIDKNEAMSEFMILGMRLTQGVSSIEFEDRFGVKLEDVFGNKLDKLIKKGLVHVEANHGIKDGADYKLTSLGLDLANSVFVEFI